MDIVPRIISVSCHNFTIHVSWNSFINFHLSLTSLELDNVNSVKEMIDILSAEYAAVEIQVTTARSGHPEHVGMEALIRIPPKVTVNAKIKKLEGLQHVIFALQIS